MSLEQFIQGFTIVTDRAAVIARVANASVSEDIHKTDETWMSCIAHTLNNAMKSVLSTNCQGPVLKVVLLDFRAMKTVTEDSNRTGWNHLLPPGFKLKQESETRFGSQYQSSERF